MLAQRGTISRWTSAIALLLLITALGCSSDHAGQASSDVTEGQEERRLPVLVTVASPVPLEAGESYPSDLYVERDVWLTPRSTGIIEKVLVERGDHVRAGQELLVLETDLQRVEVQIAEQALRFHEAESARSKQLLEDEIVSALDALRDEIERDLAASELELARAQLERCTLRAPFDGIVVERLAVPGQRVMEAEARKLMRVVGVDRRRAKVRVPETRLKGLQTGDRAEIELRGGSSIHESRVVFVSPAIDAASGTALVIVETEDQAPSLKIGSAVDVRFVRAGESEEGLFRIPRGALLGTRLDPGRAATIFVATAGHATERRVELIDLGGLEATVRGRLEAGDLVIVEGGSRLSSGDSVEVRSETR
jgi:RND family efflux transporter MFP subunit